MSIAEVRKWLKKNKVFFEVFSSSLLGVAAIAVAWASFLVSEAQLRVSEVATEPLFYIETTLFQNSNTKKYDEREMRLYNAGAPVHNISAKIKTFIKVNLFQEGIEPVYVPVEGYYFVRLPNHAPKGLIATFKGHLNNHYSSQLHFATLNPEIMKGRPFFEETIVTVTTVSYLSPFGENQKLTFLDKHMVDSSVVEPILDKYNKFRSLDIEKLTVDALLAAVNEQLQI